MRAGLSKNGSTVTFVWGEGSNVPDGHVDIKHGSFSDIFETYTAIEARKYWSLLINSGYLSDD